MKNVGRAALLLALLLVANSAQAISTPQFYSLKIEDRFGTVLDDTSGHSAAATITSADLVSVNVFGVGTVNEGTIHFTMATPNLTDDTAGSVQVVEPQNTLFVEEVVNQIFSNGQEGPVVDVTLHPIEPGFFCTPQGLMGSGPLCGLSLGNTPGPHDVTSLLFSGVAPFRVILESGAVPEPAAATLLALGVGLFATRIRGRWSRR